MKRGSAAISVRDIYLAFGERISLHDLDDDA
jgi:hypothetical protein